MDSIRSYPATVQAPQPLIPGKLWYAVYTDLDLGCGQKAAELAIANNSTAQLTLKWDSEVLAALRESVDLEYTCPKCGAKFTVEGKLL